VQKECGHCNHIYIYFISNHLFLNLGLFCATFNNISVISWRSVLLLKETGVPRRKPPTCHKSLTNFITYRDVQKECGHCNHIYIYFISNHHFSIWDCFALIKLLCLFTFRRGVDYGSVHKILLIWQNWRKNWHFIDQTKFLNFNLTLFLL
jgi:hypothetical protein